MTDPFLLSVNDDELALGDQQAGKKDDLARRAGVPRAVLDIVPIEVIEDFVTRVESWADLADDLHQALEAAGFHWHDLRTGGGGFHIASHVSDDGVLVSWATRQYTSSEPGTFEYTIEHIMQPALQAILVASGFAAEMIPEGQDNAGYIQVTGRTDYSNS